MLVYKHFVKLANKLKKQHYDAAILHYLMSKYLPSNNQLKINLDMRSTSKRLMFNIKSLHNLEVSLRLFWSENSVIILPDLETDIRVIVTGRNYFDNRKYLHEMFYSAMLKDETNLSD
jgi:hypothetical protein